MALPTITITNANLVADPELRYTPNGSAVVSFRTASNASRKNPQTGQWETTDTTFLTCSAWEGLAENIASQFSKGDKITITGRLKQREYEKDGQKRTVYDVQVIDASTPTPRHAQESNTGFGSNQPAGGSASTDEPPF